MNKFGIKKSRKRKLMGFEEFLRRGIKFDEYREGRESGKLKKGNE